jgi:AcrR family transcriptional regulator
MRREPSQLRSQETLRALLDATETVAARVGFQQATTKEIASIAGVSHPTVYRYFPSKEELLAAVVRRQWEVGVQEFGGHIALLQPAPFDEVVVRIVKLAFEMVATRVRMFGKMKIELQHVGQLNADLMSNAAFVVKGALERRASDLAELDLDVASIVVVRTVVFLARVGVQEYGELVDSGRLVNETATMIRRYIAR